MMGVKMKKVLVSSFVGFCLAVLMIGTAGSAEIVKPTVVDEITKVSATSPFCKDTYKEITGSPELLASASGDAIIRSDNSDTRYFIKVGESCSAVCTTGDEKGKTVSASCSGGDRPRCECNQVLCKCDCHR